jgi:hypothetical protein
MRSYFHVRTKVLLGIPWSRSQFKCVLYFQGKCAVVGAGWPDYPVYAANKEYQRTVGSLTTLAHSAFRTYPSSTSFGGQRRLGGGLPWVEAAYRSEAAVLLLQCGRQWAAKTLLVGHCRKSQWDSQTCRDFLFLMTENPVTNLKWKNPTIKHFFPSRVLTNIIRPSWWNFVSRGSQKLFPTVLMHSSILGLEYSIMGVNWDGGGGVFPSS